MNTSLGVEHAAFIKWSKSQGIKIHGVTPAAIPGRRSGMVAARRIYAGETILTVPLAAMLTIDSVPLSFVRMFSDGTSLHAILAAFLTHGDPILLKKWEYWRQVWPPRDDFEKSLPLFWPKILRANKGILPPSVSGSWLSPHKKPGDIDYESRYTNILTQQENRLRDAWAEVVLVFPHTDWNTFSYNWLILNTRSFFYVSPGRGEPEDWNDAIALVPFADYFNHDDEAVSLFGLRIEALDMRHNLILLRSLVKLNLTVTITHLKRLADLVSVGMRSPKARSRRRIEAMRKEPTDITLRIEKGQELYMSYGSHPNDFLLVEYGFLPDNNRSDAIFLDSIILRELATTKKKELASQQLYGNYKVTSSGVCHRTKVVSCLKYMSGFQWRDYVLGRGRGDEIRTANIIHGWIGAYLKESITNIKILEDMQIDQQSDPQDGEKEMFDVLLRRWNQIRVLCEEALKAFPS